MPRPKRLQPLPHSAKHSSEGDVWFRPTPPWNGKRSNPKTKKPFAIALKSREPYGFAGLWEPWHDKAAGAELLTFSAITTHPNAVVEPLHNRMPVILPERRLQPLA
jgi:putative SOS response-associated peptidase YedK